MKLLLSVLGLLFILAWLIEMWLTKHVRARREREEGRRRPWWKEPRDGGDDLDGDY